MPDQPIEPPKPPAPLPELPEQYEIPVALIEQWVGLPSSQRIQASLTKQDIDHLIVGLLRGADAQVALQDALLHWSNARNEQANQKLFDFRRLNLESQNRFRQFATGLMFAVVQGNKNAS
jgi:hypothetical protein